MPVNGLFGYHTRFMGILFLLYRLKIYCKVYMLFLEYTHINEELPIKAYHIF